MDSQQQAGTTVSVLVGNADISRVAYTATKSGETTPYRSGDFVRNTTTGAFTGTIFLDEGTQQRIVVSAFKGADLVATGQALVDVVALTPQSVTINLIQTSTGQQPPNEKQSPVILAINMPASFAFSLDGGLLNLGFSASVVDPDGVGAYTLPYQWSENCVDASFTAGAKGTAGAGTLPAATLTASKLETCTLTLRVGPDSQNLYDVWSFPVTFTAPSDTVGPVVVGGAFVAQPVVTSVALNSEDGNCGMYPGDSSCPSRVLLSGGTSTVRVNYSRLNVVPRVSISANCGASGSGTFAVPTDQPVTTAAAVFTWTEPSFTQPTLCSMQAKVWVGYEVDGSNNPVDGTGLWDDFVFSVVLGAAAAAAP